LALGLGTLAVAGRPERGHVVKLDARELAEIVGREADHVTPVELSAWIGEGRADYRLIDLRSPEAYAAAHIPGAENVPLAALPEYGLLRNEKIVLYSDGGIHAAQAWMFLQALGYAHAYTLLGGLDAWRASTGSPSGQAPLDEIAPPPARAPSSPPSIPPAVPRAGSRTKKEGC